MAEDTEDKMNPGQLLVGIIDRPATTMSYVGKRPGWAWVTPALLVLVGLAVFSVVTAPLTSELALRQAQQQMASLPPQQAEQAAAQLEKFTSPPVMAGFSIVGGLITLAVMWLVWAGVLYFLGLVAGGEASFAQSFALLAWSWLPYSLRNLTLAAYVAYKGQLINQGLSFLVATGDPTKDTANWLYGLLSQFDLFYLWHLILVIVGLVAIGRFSKTKATIVGLIYLAATTALSLAPIFVRSLFS
ncbi:MAG TPA: YIP1 family protein [Anaerolineae bacterium]|nr:YIP1 family protein [Anaerolineae bacterium]